MQPAIRVNTLKATVAEVHQLLTNHGFVLESVAEQPTAFIVNNKSTKELTAIPEYAAGLFYIQNLSSQLVAIALNPQPDEKILDLTAAPGSKTTHIAALMKNTGQIVANDISRSRMYKLKANITRYGVTNVTFEYLPGERLWMKYQNYFDRTLLDAPCSMQGTAEAEEVTPKEIKKLAKRQQWLLRAAVSATRPGGIIVYSTCTTTVEENEQVVNWMIQKDKNIEVLEMKRITPDDHHEGFFIATLRKLS